MKVQTETHGSITILVPHGPLIGEEALDLRSAIETTNAHHGPRIVVDMADVPYVDSAGIEMLLELGDITASPLHRPRLAAFTDTCREALELTDALQRLEVFDTVDNALRSCQR
jgi:anti-anti-sigma factor